MADTVLVVIISAISIQFKELSTLFKCTEEYETRSRETHSCLVSIEIKSFNLRLIHDFYIASETDFIARRKKEIIELN